MMLSWCLGLKHDSFPWPQSLRSVPALAWLIHGPQTPQRDTVPPSKTASPAVSPPGSPQVSPHVSPASGSFHPFFNMSEDHALLWLAAILGQSVVFPAAAEPSGTGHSLWTLLRTPHQVCPMQPLIGKLIFQTRLHVLRKRNRLQETSWARNCL